MVDGAVLARVRSFIQREEGVAADVEDIVNRLKREFPGASNEELEESIIETAANSGMAVFWRGYGPRKRVRAK